MKNGSTKKKKKAKKKKSKKVTFGRGNCVQNTSSIWRELFCELEEKTLGPTTFVSSPNQKPTKNAFSPLFSPQFSILPKISPYKHTIGIDGRGEYTKSEIQ